MTALSELDPAAESPNGLLWRRFETLIPLLDLKRACLLSCVVTASSRGPFSGWEDGESTIGATAAAEPPLLSPEEDAVAMIARLCGACVKRGYPVMGQVRIAAWYQGSGAHFRHEGVEIDWVGSFFRVCPDRICFRRCEAEMPTPTERPDRILSVDIDQTRRNTRSFPFASSIQTSPNDSSVARCCEAYSVFMSETSSSK